MSMNAETRTATILPFPRGGRFNPVARQPDRPVARPVIVESGAGAWYHEEAIREADPKGRA